MERKRVNSSKIRSAGYDPKSQTLELEFSDGKIVSYRGVSPEVHRRFMAALPDQRRLRLGEHAALLCHGSPRAISEFLWESTTPDGLVARLLDDARAQLILCTHSGIKWHRRLADGRHLVNVGVIGRPENDGTPRVWYTLLTAEPGRDLEVEFIPLAYDHEALAREMEAEALPPEFAATVRTGWWTTCLEVLPARERARGRF